MAPSTLSVSIESEPAQFSMRDSVCCIIEVFSNPVRVRAGRGQESLRN